MSSRTLDLIAWTGITLPVLGDGLWQLQWLPCCHVLMKFLSRCFWTHVQSVICSVVNLFVCALRLLSLFVCLFLAFVSLFLVSPVRIRP